MSEHSKKYAAIDLNLTSNNAVPDCKGQNITSLMCMGRQWQETLSETNLLHILAFLYNPRLKSD